MNTKTNNKKECAGTSRSEKSTTVANQRSKGPEAKSSVSKPATGKTSGHTTSKSASTRSHATSRSTK